MNKDISPASVGLYQGYWQATEMYECLLLHDFPYNKYWLLSIRSTINEWLYNGRDRRGHDRMVAGFTTTYAISAYHH